jgi:hypothetical protein
LSVNKSDLLENISVKKENMKERLAYILETMVNMSEMLVNIPDSRLQS